MKPRTTTIYILLEDPRETGLIKGNGISGKVCYSLREACEVCLKRIWYFEPEWRKDISEAIETEGPIAAYEKFCSAWLYCPTFVKRRVRLPVTLS